MTEELLSTTAKKSLIALILQQLWPILLSIILSGAAYLYALGAETILLPQYRKWSLALLATLLCTTILFLILWLRLHFRYERFHLAYGIFWDKKFNARCLFCRTPLKYSSHGPETLYCPNPICQQKFILKDHADNPISKHEAIEKMKTS